MATAMDYPLHLELDAPLEVARWRPLVSYILAIPHFIVAGVLGFAFFILSVVAWFTILFTGEFPHGIFDWMATAMRYQWRASSYAYFMRESYPPFDWTPGAADPGGDPATLSIAYPEHLSRGLIFVKGFLLIPHFIALIVIGIGEAVAMFIAFFAVLFTGSWPQGLRDFVVGATRWSNRVQAYGGLMTDVYPPFSTS